MLLRAVLVFDPCRNVTCQNGGTCQPNGKAYICDCELHYYGHICEGKFPPTVKRQTKINVLMLVYLFIL